MVPAVVGSVSVRPGGDIGIAVAHGGDGATDTIAPRAERSLVIAIIAFATLNALLWSLVRAPLHGGPDESAHFRVMHAIVDTGGLAEFQGYGPGAFAGGPVRAQVAHEITPNAFAIPVGYAQRLIGSDDLAFNVHVARLFMVALFPITLWLAYLTLRRLFPTGPVERIWGIGLMAAVPMFTLVHSYYTNDASAIAAGTFAAYATVRAHQSNFRTRDVLLLGVALGMVGLHKYTGFLVFPAVAGGTLWRLWRRPMRFVAVGAALVAIAAAIAAWWYMRNWVLYADPFGVEVTQAAVDASGGAPVPPRTRGLSPVGFVQETNWIGENFATFWAGYGLEKMKIPGAAYVALSVLVVVAAIGFVVRAVRCRGAGPSIAVPILALMAFLHLGLWAASFWSSYTVDVALSGRYVYPSFVSFVVLVIAGLTGLVAWRGRAGAALVATIPVMLAANVAYFVQTVVPDVVALGT